MKALDRAAVRERAEFKCEYCQLTQADSPLAPLQIEHIIPRTHGGGDELDNLALACVDCNLHKGPNLTGIDPRAVQITPLFNPRVQLWNEHFAWKGVRIVGITAVGRATVRVLNLNSIQRLQFRSSRPPA